MLYNDFLINLGLNIKKARLKLNYTQAYLGELLDISEHRISQIECGKCNLTLKTLNKIINILNIKPEKLFYFED